MCNVCFQACVHVCSLGGVTTQTCEHSRAKRGDRYAVQVNVVCIGSYIACKHHCEKTMASTGRVLGCVVAWLCSDIVWHAYEDIAVKTLLCDEHAVTLLQVRRRQ
jgi:hypothetical protein